VRLNELFNAREAAANPTDKPIIKYLCEYLLGPKHVVSIAKARNWQLNPRLINVFRKHLVNFIALHSFIPIHVGNIFLRHFLSVSAHLGQRRVLFLHFELEFDYLCFLSFTFILAGLDANFQFLHTGLLLLVEALLVPELHTPLMHHEGHFF
jgi:hypothetical protein